jgi:hypothetical protein
MTIHCFRIRGMLSEVYFGTIRTGPTVTVTITARIHGSKVTVLYSTIQVMAVQSLPPTVTTLS